MTNILILGNGFDLAHDLPTKYDDFLGFSQRLLYIYTLNTNCKLSEYINKHLDTWAEGSKYLKDQLISIFDKRVPDNTGNVSKTSVFPAVAKVNDEVDNFRKLLVNNVWFHYFVTISTTSTTRKEKLIRGGNWIDFESEISFVIQHLDREFEDIEERVFVEQRINQIQVNSTHNKDVVKNLEFFNNQKLLEFYRTCRNDCKDIINDCAVKLQALRDRLYDDLEKLISAFNFYLVNFVEKIPLTEEISFVKNVDPIYAISFNYTRTFERLYSHIQTPGADLEHPVHICHVHGETSGCAASNVANKTNKANTADTANGANTKRSRMDSNIVIGIDDYWETPEDQAKRTNFAIFKKFVQRIRKRTSLDYVKWIKKLEDEDMSVYIFGHSLNITDKEILEPFLKSEKTKLHIYARNEASEGSLISNLILLIGRDAVIKKSLSKQIVFVRGEKS